MNWLNIIYIAISILSTVITVGIPAFLSLRNAWKARKAAETEAEKAKANADLLATAKAFISAAEVAFEGFDKMMKSQGQSAGAMKKDNVFSKLQAYALQNGYTFDADEWSNKIDELVAFTKNVNSKK
jgi:hypothetical protein